MNREMFKALRQFTELTQKDFAKSLGVSDSTIDAVEAGRRPVSAFIKGRVAAAYKIDDAFLSFYDNYKTIKSTE